MRLQYVIILFLFSLSLNAQHKTFDGSQSKQELLEFIRSNSKLNDDYNKSLQYLESSQTWGNKTVVIMTISIVPWVISLSSDDANTQNIVGSIALVSLVTSWITGTIALRKRSKGRKLKEKTLNYARGASGSKFMGALHLQSTHNGISLVYSF